MPIFNRHGVFSQRQLKSTTAIHTVRTSISRPQNKMVWLLIGDRWVVGRLLVDRWPVSMTPECILITRPWVACVGECIHDVWYMQALLGSYKSDTCSPFRHTSCVAVGMTTSVCRSVHHRNISSTAWWVAVKFGAETNVPPSSSLCLTLLFVISSVGQ